GVRNRAAIVGWLAVVCEQTGRQLEAREFRGRAKELERRARRLQRRARPITISHEINLPAGSNNAAVVRQSTTLKFGGEGLPLDQLPEALAGLGTPALGKPAEATGVARNAPCPCGSGRKFKRCCGKDRAGDYT
ncbi:SEC-C motif domain protein, partial [mine drainage metagenome]